MKSGAARTREHLSTGPILTLHWDVLQAVLKTVGATQAESGGPIGGTEADDGVSIFHFDETSRTSGVTYSPDYRALNQLFRDDWNPKGLRLRGFVHSHPGRNRRPSSGDEEYAERILLAIDDLPFLWLPIVNTVPETGQFRLTPWAAYRETKGVSVVRGKVRVIQAHPAMKAAGDTASMRFASQAPLDEIVIGRPKGDVPSAPPGRDVTFDRVRIAYDLELMGNAAVIVIGVGGAAESLENLARAGLGRFVLIDPDVVSETNLATQQTYRRDIGRPKVDCIAERIHDINPAALVTVLATSLDDLSDDAIRAFIFPAGSARDGRVVLAGFTDNFLAQARVNRIALNLGIPSICAQVYREGRGGEITFTYPGVTPACHRCILSSRYHHFLEADQPNDVTSHGTPIFSTARLNALKGFLILALLHHGSDHPRWGRMLSRIGRRNLVQIRMDPDFAETLGMTVFDRVLGGADSSRLFFDEVVWLPQAPENEANGYAPCPDCGGTGDLRDSKNRIEDTRISLCRSEDGCVSTAGKLSRTTGGANETVPGE